MAIQAKYDPKQDRMLVSINLPDDVHRTFWLTRRQWLGLLHAVNALKLVPAEDKAPPQEPRKGPLKPLPPQPGAVTAHAVRIKRDGDAVRIQIQAEDGEGVGMKLQAKGLLDLQRMLDQQAERVGWDPRAGLERLGAAVEANRAMRKAQGGT